MVAQAAPATPQWRTKMAMGSRTMLMTHPTRVESMANLGLPSARMTELRPLVRTKKGMPMRMTLK